LKENERGKDHHLPFFLLKREDSKVANFLDFLQEMNDKRKRNSNPHP
jgi:hypothetical protein